MLGEAIVGFSGYPRSYLGWSQYRGLGAAALDLCAVAEGVLDGYAVVGGSSLGSWDYLGGLLVCREAGAVVGEALGRELVTLEHTDRRRPVAADARRGRELASRLRAGSVMVNDVASYYGISEAPQGAAGPAVGDGRTRGSDSSKWFTQNTWMSRVAGAAKAWWFGYTSELAFAADRFVDFLFARIGAVRVSALTSRRGARRLIFRRDRI